MIVIALAAHRATWMILAEDGPADIFRDGRNWIDDNVDPAHWVARGFNCPYCISFWLALLFALAPAFVAEWFAAAYVARWLLDKDRA